ncbi:hypothetical protein V5O48_019317, partial [Marasmius crinis-equi]
MTGSRVVQLSSKSGKITWSSDAVPATIGFAALNQANEQIPLSTGSDLRIYQLPAFSHLRTMKSIPPIVRFPKQVAFTSEGDLIVAGTDAGRAVVYETKSGKAVQSLSYPRGGLVQSVAMGTSGGSCYIVIAGSTSQQVPDVIIWRRKPSDDSDEPESDESKEISGPIRTVSGVKLWPSFILT